MDVDDYSDLFWQVVGGYHSTTGGHSGKELHLFKGDSLIKTNPFPTNARFLHKVLSAAPTTHVNSRLTPNEPCRCSNSVV